MNIIKNKIDKFIRRYYYNQILTGMILLVGISILLLLSSVFIEHFSWLSGTGRAIIFWSTISIIGIIFILLVLLPFLKIFRLGKTITYDKAAKIIGKFFPEIRDKLLNCLQLEEMQNSDANSNDLLIKSINQKTEKLSPINFAKAVDFSTTKKYLLYVLPLAIIVVVFFIIKPVFFKKPVERIINYQKEYVKPQLFYIYLQNNNLEAVQNTDYTITFNIKGDNYPDNLILYYKDDDNRATENTYLIKDNDTTYTFTFKRIQSNITFYAGGNNIYSETYYLKVIPKPVLLGFELQLDYPKYTGKRAETIENTGIIEVLYGTKGKWKFLTKDTDGIIVSDGNKTDTISSQKKDSFIFDSYFNKNQKILVSSFNKYMQNEDTLSYEIRIVNDLYPDIQVIEIRDSVLYKNIYFSGTISDDYGFSSLKYYYRVLNFSSGDGSFISKSIDFEKNTTRQKFYWTINIDELNLLPGNSMEYYFEVCDNDSEKGYKCSTTQITTYNKLTYEEMNSISEVYKEEFKDEIAINKQELKDIRNELEELLRTLREKDNLDFQDREKLEKLLEKQQEIQSRLEQQSEQMKTDNFQQNELNQFNENILEKQAKLEELMNKILDEDMKKLISDLEKMLEDFNKDKLDEQLRDLNLNNEELEKQLDQTFELFKRLEFEQEFNKAISKLDSLTKDLNALNEKSENSEKNELGNHLDEQKEINKQFEELREQLDKIEELNNNLEEKHNIDFKEEMQEQISEDLSTSEKKLSKNDKSASKSQKSASEKMEKLSESLQMQFDSDFAEQQEEDIENLRRILENIIHLSFKEEQYTNEAKIIKRSDPQYINLIKDQNIVNNQIRLVNDSLAAIARRNFEVSGLIFDKIDGLQSSTASATKNLENRNTYKAAVDLQASMITLNELALLLSESINKMDEEDSGMCSSSCPNGKKKKKSGSNGKPSMSTIKDLQEQLNQQLKDLKSQQNKAGIPGQTPGMSEQFARMAAQQEAIRRALEEMQKDLRSQGQSMDGSLQEAIEAMETTEDDLINKRLTESMMNRQEQIMTRMLQSEKAQKEREQDNKRESKQGRIFERKSPEEIFNDSDKDKSMDNILKTVPPNLNNYYKQKIDRYRYGLDNK
ncbi:MAG: hypothetical protein M0Q94_03330 [Candidatus Cloacimonetes bacterium]|nr:hypothetical protein [Candidatus Cloacimonadota bacterium]